MRANPDTLTLPALTAALRGAGIVVGVHATLEATRALSFIDLRRRGDVRDALRCTLVTSHDDQQIFDQLFDLLYPEDRIAIPGTQPALPRSQDLPPAAGGRRIAAVLPSPTIRSLQAPDVVERDAAGSASDVEAFASKDFEQMSASELAVAARLLRMPPPPPALRRTRRLTSVSRGQHIDLGAVLRAAARGDELATLRFQSPMLTPRDWILLIDISGSMATYARMALHLAHGLTHHRPRVETFLFATRLTRITRALQLEEPDMALQRVTRTALDWDGGTRIGESLAEFNREWGRRVLTRSPVVVLMTDGLERGSAQALERELVRLRRNSRELVWINPLRRNPHYEPLAAGAAVITRLATRTYAAHNVDSLLGLVRDIEGPLRTRSRAQEYRRPAAAP